MKALLVSLFLLLGCAAYGEGVGSSGLWFPVGEVLNYKMKWGLVSIGSARVEAAEVEKDGKRLISIRYSVRTNMVFNKIYPVKDDIETIIDPEGFLPVSYRRSIQRRSSKCSETVDFDHKKGVASWNSECMSRSGTFEIESDTRDIMSLLYFMRQNRFKEGDSVTNRVVVTTNVTDIVVNVGKTKKLDAGGIDDVESFQITPVAQLDDLLVDEGAVEAWVSADARMIMTRLEIKATFGTIKTTLYSVEGPGGDRWVKASKGATAEDSD